MDIVSRPTGIQKIDHFMKDVVAAFKQLVQVRLSGVNKGVKPAINFIAGSGITITVKDNPGAGSVDVTIGVA
jgi:hypothetical protein